MRIDVHAHYWAASYLELLMDLGRPDLRHVGRQVDDFDERVALLDRLGVDMQILSAIGLNVEVPDPDDAVTAVHHINGLYVDIMSRYPGRFNAFASVPLPHVEQSIVETNRALDELGLAGIGLPCIVNGKAIDHEDYAEFWRNIGERPTPTVIYVHPAGSDSSAHPGLDKYGLVFALGSPLQIAAAPIRLALSGITTRYPNIKFIFALCGGILPYLWPRYERNLRRGIEQSAVAAAGANMFAWMKPLGLDPEDPMSIMRKNFWFDTSIQDMPAALRLAGETYGVDKLLLGSDEIFASLEEAIALIENSVDLTDEEKHHILDVNAAALLGLVPSELAR
jgi:aminocarboxymuconate-semialdehyde decarboxylase